MPDVIVTGASRGLGLAIARRLTSAGFRVVAVARKETNALLAAMDEPAARGALRFVPFDLTDIAGLSGLARAIREDTGPIYGLVNNAAVAFDGALALMPVAQIEQMVRLNTLAPIV